VARIYIDSWDEGFGDLLGRRAAEDRAVARWVDNLTTGPQRWWVSERNGRIVGFVGLGPSRDPVEPGLGELDTIAVAPTEWGKGVGRALMSVALDGLAETFSEGILWTLASYERGRRLTWRQAGPQMAEHVAKGGRSPSGEGLARRTRALGQIGRYRHARHADERCRRCRPGCRTSAGTGASFRTADERAIRST